VMGHAHTDMLMTLAEIPRGCSLKFPTLGGGDVSPLWSFVGVSSRSVTVTGWSHVRASSADSDAGAGLVAVRAPLLGVVAGLAVGFQKSTTAAEQGLTPLARTR
jgi:hypothetical protein